MTLRYERYANALGKYYFCGYMLCFIPAYTLSYGCGIMVFAVRGAIRKYSSLR